MQVYAIAIRQKTKERMLEPKSKIGLASSEMNQRTPVLVVRKKNFHPIEISWLISSEKQSSKTYLVIAVSSTPCFFLDSARSNYLADVATKDVIHIIDIIGGSSRRFCRFGLGSLASGIDVVVVVNP